MAKEKIVMVRMEEEKHGKFERAAKAVGKTVSGWLRWLGEREVAPPSNEAILAHSRGYGQTTKRIDVPAKRTAAEIAAMIPGVRLGLETESPEPQATPYDLASDSNEPLWDEPPLPKFNWAAKFALWKSHGDEGDGEMKEFLAELNLPKTFWALRDSRYRLAWLEENRPNG